MNKAVLTPREIVAELDKHIIGQAAAKRSVAIALRNRYRRMQVTLNLRNEITPKNILMIGPTGVGKTEIARRLAKLADAPFIKVEATKFTEVGYVGRDVESIIRDLMEIAIKQVREKATLEIKERALKETKERIVKALMPKRIFDLSKDESLEENEEESDNTDKYNELMTQLDNHELDEQEIELEVANSIGVEIMAPPGMEEMTNQLQGLFQNLAGNRTKARKMKVKEAFDILTEEESSKLIDNDKIKAQAIEITEQHGIVFLDEIDKVTQRSGHSSGADVSREGVQRDLLPLVEGCSVSTKYGVVKTDHILFIASGAFHLAKPSDLIPELQGRLPLRVELDALKTEDFVRILTEPDASLTEQYKALLGIEGIDLQFESSGIQRLAEFAWQVNEQMENIGARRLHTVLERVLEKISFEANTKETLIIDKAYVEEQLNNLISNPDLSRFIL